MENKNEDIRQEVSILLEKENGNFELFSPTFYKFQHPKIKTRGESDHYQPGSLAKNPGTSVLNGIRECVSNGAGGNLGNYVDLNSTTWSQSNSIQSGHFTFGGVECKYAVANMNAGYNNTGYNSICTIEVNEYSNIYSIKLIACYHSSPIMTIETRDYYTYLSLRRYIGY